MKRQNAVKKGTFGVSGATEIQKLRQGCWCTIMSGNV